MFKAVDIAKYRGTTVGIATGGTSPERAISLATGKAFQKALTLKGYEAVVYDIATDLDQIASTRPAVMLLGVHGGFGESGVLQGFLESLEIPYTGSGVLASALAMDKKRTKVLAANAGVQVARDRLLRLEELANVEGILEEIEAAFSYPLVAKLNDSGSSYGVYLAQNVGELQHALTALRADLIAGVSAAVIVEEFLEGPEFSVGYFDRECLGTMKIVPQAEFYDYNAKYERTDTVYELIDASEITSVLENMGRLVLDALGCRGVARVDFKGDPLGTSPLGMLEVNTIPGMTATSLVPKLAAARGIGFEDFVEVILAGARLDSVRK